MTVRSMQEDKVINHDQVSRKVIVSHKNGRRCAMKGKQGSLQSQLHAQKTKETIVKFRKKFANKIFLKLMTRSKVTIKRIK